MIWIIEPVYYVDKDLCFAIKLYLLAHACECRSAH